jgi:hypothetical protein
MRLDKSSSTMIDKSSSTMIDKYASISHSGNTPGQQLDVGTVSTVGQVLTLLVPVPGHLLAPKKLYNEEDSKPCGTDSIGCRLG